MAPCAPALPVAVGKDSGFHCDSVKDAWQSCIKLFALEALCLIQFRD
jgi:hypothetical protein